MVRLAAELVRIPSVTGDELAGAARLAALLRDRGWASARVVADTNVVADIGHGKPSTCLLAYLDTPPPGAMREPFDGAVVDGAAFGRSGPVLRGRGAVTKGGLAAAMVAAETAAGAAAVRLAATSRDNDGLTAVLSQLTDVRSAVQAEPTDLAIALEARGIVWLELTIIGRPAHAGSPAAAVEPIAQLARAIAALEHVSLPTHERLSGATIAPVGLRSVREAPLTASSATAVLDRRLLPGEDPDAARAGLERFVLSVVPDANARVTVVNSMHPYGVDLGCKTLIALTRAARAALGSDPLSGPLPFATNAGLACASGIETVAFGPGRIADLGDDEHVAAAQLAAAERVLAAFLADPL